MHEGGTMDKLALQKMAVEVRKGIVSSVHSAKAGHPGGSLSAADIFTYLYFEEITCQREKHPTESDTLQQLYRYQRLAAQLCTWAGTPQDHRSLSQADHHIHR